MCPVVETTLENNLKALKLFSMIIMQVVITVNDNFHQLSKLKMPLLNCRSVRSIWMTHGNNIFIFPYIR